MSDHRPESKGSRRIDELHPVEREQHTEDNHEDAQDELRRQVESCIG